MEHIAALPTPSKRMRVLLTLLVIALVALVVVLDARRREAEQKLQNLSVRLEQLRTGSNTQSNLELARQVVQKVREHMNLPDTPEPTVATIVDIEKLKQRNTFYTPAENGDYLIVTSTRAVLYDPDTDRILDVVPIQIQPAARPTAGG